MTVLYEFYLQALEADSWTAALSASVRLSPTETGVNSPPAISVLSSAHTSSGLTLGSDRRNVAPEVDECSAEHERTRKEAETRRNLLMSFNRSLLCAGLGAGLCAGESLYPVTKFFCTAWVSTIAGKFQRPGSIVANRTAIVAILRSRTVARGVRACFDFGHRFKNFLSLTRSSFFAGCYYESIYKLRLFAVNRKNQIEHL